MSVILWWEYFKTGVVEVNGKENWRISTTKKEKKRNWLCARPLLQIIFI
jgi:hypothetical protein